MMKNRNEKYGLVARIVGGVALVTSLTACGTPGSARLSPAPPQPSEPSRRTQSLGRGEVEAGSSRLGVNYLSPQEVRSSSAARRAVAEEPIIDLGPDTAQAAMIVQQPTPGLVSKRADNDLLTKVNRLIDEFVGSASEGEVRATVENGVVTLEGTIRSAANKYELEARIKALSGVATVNDDRLSATNE